MNCYRVLKVCGLFVLLNKPTINAYYIVTCRFINTSVITVAVI